MKMFLNFNGIYKSGTYATVAAEIHDEVIADGYDCEFSECREEDEYEEEVDKK